VNNIRAQKWYNGAEPRNLSGFMNDTSNRLIGWPTMRQIRVKPSSCSVNSIHSECLDDYNQFNEEKDSFQPGWINETTQETPNSPIDGAFIYRSSNELDTYVYVGDHGTYDGGGYAYEFRGRLIDIRNNLSQLHQLQWIDNHTRAVIIQLTLYNPNAELFTSVTFLIEFLSTGGAFPTARFEPFDFTAFASHFQLVCIILLMSFIVYFMIRETRLFLKLKWSYLTQFWSLIEVGVIVCSWTAGGICLWRHEELQRIENLFNQTNGYVYIDLQLASYVNDLLNFLFGFCCFFGTMKFLHVCHFSERLSLFNQTLRYAANQLIAFSIMAFIIFTAFLCLFYLLFNSKMGSCSSLLETSQMLFEMTLLAFDASELSDAATFLGPFCCSLFIFLVVFICSSMFISIINSSFRHVRGNMNGNDEMILFMLTKFQRWIGMKVDLDLDDKILLIF
jgi:polycystin 1L2